MVLVIFFLLVAHFFSLVFHLSHRAFENRFYIINRRLTRYQKVNVWCVILIDRCIGPYLMVAYFGIPFLKILMEELLNNLLLQQDGCPGLSTGVVRRFSYHRFTERWKCTFDPIHNPLRSPDLTPFYFFYWGALKQSVSSN